MTHISPHAVLKAARRVLDDERIGTPLWPLVGGEPHAA